MCSYFPSHYHECRFVNGCLGISLNGHFYPYPKCISSLFCGSCSLMCFSFSLARWPSEQSAGTCKKIAIQYVPLCSIYVEMDMSHDIVRYKASLSGVSRQCCWSMCRLNTSHFPNAESHFENLRYSRCNWKLSSVTVEAAIPRSHNEMMSPQCSQGRRRIVLFVLVSWS